MLPGLAQLTCWKKARSAGSGRRKWCEASRSTRTAFLSMVRSLGGKQEGVARSLFVNVVTVIVNSFSPSVQAPTLTGQMVSQTKAGLPNCRKVNGTAGSFYFSCYLCYRFSPHVTTYSGRTDCVSKYGSGDFKWNDKNWYVFGRFYFSSHRFLDV